MVTLTFSMGDALFVAALAGSAFYGIGFMLGERSGEKTGKLLGEMDERIRRMREALKEQP